MKQKNELSNSTSPYLRQHADNPVAWQLWSEATLELAKQEKKPILLSIGYSACHWCHVMAHESFADAETAEIMNAHFINIKVDREQRPDLDKIYQTTHALLTQRSGGWPLTVFLDAHTQIPFFSGTYFPKEARHGLPAFREVLLKVAEYFKQYPQEVLKQGKQLHANLQRIYAPRKSQSYQPEDITATAYRQLQTLFDKQYGGFGEAPKFPQTANLNLLLYCAEHFTETKQPSDATQAATIALHSLQAMTLSGVYDQVGGGFYRYAVDRAWRIPHFEKMLYDNALLLAVLADASLMTGVSLFKNAVDETAQWLLDEMTDADGGFYASIDADAQGHEGRYYTWSCEEIQSLCSREDYQHLQAYWNLQEAPNFEGQWHLNVIDDSIREQDKQHRLRTIKAALLAVRKQRTPPDRDDKILTAWNALTITGLAKAAMMSQNQTYAQAAWRAFNFIRQSMWDGKRLHAYDRQQHSQAVCYLDDYAFLLEACITLLQLRWDNTLLEFTQQLAKALIEQFEDSEHGGYFFTPHQHESLLQRPRTFHDEALPAGYAVATYTLIRLAMLCGDEAYLHSAKRALEQASTSLQHEPNHCATLVYAASMYHRLPTTIILRGQQEAMQAWQQLAQQYFSTQRLCFAIPNSAQSNLPPALAAKTPSTEAAVCAFICQGTQCLAPLSTLTAFEDYLAKHSLKLTLQTP